jgi:hypothetical protein
MSNEVLINGSSVTRFELFSINRSDWNKILKLKITEPNKKLNEIIKSHLLDKFKIYH